MHKFVLFGLIIFSPVILFAQKKIVKEDLNRLKLYMSGSFNSELQSKNDSDFFNIHLTMKPIWEDRTDGFWLYVEQAIVSSLDRPYRQRIYHVNIFNDTVIKSEVFEMKSPLRFAGAFKDISKLKSLTLDSIESRTGCAILLKVQKDKSFIGSTNQQDCASSLRGATYATSEVLIFEDKLVSWDRGWDKDAKQVWGAVKWGYQFIKQKN